MLKKVVIKLSGEAIAGNIKNHLYDDSVISNIVVQIKTILANNIKAALVVGGGNIWRGRMAPPDMDRSKADQIGMLATVMNAIYLAEAFKKQKIPAKVMTPLPFANMTAQYDKDNAMALMEAGTVIINAAGLGHPFFSTDTITALRAAELEADCVLYAKHVDGVYDRDPSRSAAARKYRNLSYQTAIERDLNAADIAAMHLSKEAGIPSYIFALEAENSIVNACAWPDTGRLKGTYISIRAEKEDDFYVTTN